jgi:hypothetical protein
MPAPKRGLRPGEPTKPFLLASAPFFFASFPVARLSEVAIVKVSLNDVAPMRELKQIDEDGIESLLLR